MILFSKFLKLIFFMIFFNNFFQANFLLINWKLFSNNFFYENFFSSKLWKIVLEKFSPGSVLFKDDRFKSVCSLIFCKWYSFLLALVIKIRRILWRQLNVVINYLSALSLLNHYFYNILDINTSSYTYRL